MGRLFEEDHNEDELEGIDNEEEDDDFSDLDDETQERLAKYQQKQEQRWQQELRRREEAIEGVGLAFDAQGRVAIQDTNKFGSYAQPFARNQQQQETRQQPVNPQQEEDEEEWASPDYDREKFEKQLAKRIAKETQKYQDAIGNMQSFIVEDRIEQAMEKVESAVEKHAPYLKDLLEHPEFEGAMRTALGSLRMDQWRSPKDLVRVVGMIAPDLGETLPPKQTKREPNLESKVRADLNRSTLKQTAPSRSNSGGTVKEYSDVDKLVAEQLGISVEEAWSLGQDTNGTAYRQHQKQLTKNGKR